MKIPHILTCSIAALAGFQTKKASLTRALAVGIGLSCMAMLSNGSAQTNQTWNQLNADNTWNLTSANWDAGVAWTQNNNPIFGTAGETLTLNVDSIIFNDLTFNVTGYTIVAGAGSLVLGNDQSSSITVTAGTATIAETMANSANGASSLTTLGAGTLVLSGLNTYSGNTFVNAGTLSVGVLNNTGTVGNVGTGGMMVIGSGTTGATLLYTGSGETTDRVIDLAGTTGGVTLTQSGASGNLKFTSNLTASGAGIKTLTLNGSTAATGEIAGAIVDNSASNTTSLAKSGTGTWILSGNNTYSGAVTLTGGVLWLRSGNALGATTAGTTQSGASELRISGGIVLGAEPISINGGGIGNAGALRNFSDDNTYSGTLTLAAQSRIVSDSGTLTMNGTTAVTGTQNLILSGAGNFVIAGAITTGTGVVTKDALVGNGTGVLTLRGANTYTGATTAGAGTLRLDYTNNDNSKLSDSAALVLGAVTTGIPSGPLLAGGSILTGGTVELVGGTHTEVVGSTTLTTNTPASTISRSSGNAVLQLNTINPNTGTGLIFTGSGIATADNPISNGILGFWARMNVGGVSTWATSGGTDDSPVVAFTGYTDINRLGSTVPNLGTNHVRIINGGSGGNITLSGGALTQAYTLQMDASAGAATITAATSTDILNLGDDTGGAIWQTSNAGSLTIGSAPGNGVLTAGAFDIGAPANLRLINDSLANSLVINSVIANNGSEAVGVTKTGPGTVVLNGDNTFTGALTVVSNGTLILTGNNAARPNSTTGATVLGGGSLQLQANAANTVGGVSTVLSNEQTGTLQPLVMNNGGTIQLRSDTAVTFAGGNNFGGVNAINFTFDVNRLTAAGSNQTLIFAPGTIPFGNAVTINVTGGNGYTLSLGSFENVTGGSSNLSLNPTTGKLTIVGYANRQANANNSTLSLSGSIAGNTVTGVIANQASGSTGTGTVAVTKTGSSTWDLQGANTYTGTTTVREGTITISGNRTATSGGITIGDTAGLNGTLNITNGNFSLGTSTFILSNQSNSSTVNQSGGAIAFTGGTQLIVGNTAPGSIGTYNLSGGSLTGAGVANRGVILGTNTGTTGIFNLSGTGNLAMGLATLQVGRSDSTVPNSTGIFNQTGGTAAIGTLTVGGGAGSAFAGNSGTLNLMGGTFSATNFTLLAAADNSTANITIGGTAQVTLPAFPTVRGLNAKATLTFDGGTLSPSAASATYISSLTNAFLTSNGAKFDVASGRDITILQPLQDAAAQAGTLTKLGLGTLTLSGANTYTGTTTVTAGSLIVNGSLAGGAVNVANGASFGGTATIGGNVGTVSGARIVPGGSTIAGTISVGGLTLVNGATVEFDLGASNDLINVTNAGSLALNGGVFSVFNSGTLTPFTTNGTYPLIDYAGSFTGSTTNISIGNAQAGKFYAINNDAANTLITLTIADATVTEWNAGSGSWTTAANWTGGVPNAAGAVAKFGTIPISPTTVTLNGAKTVGGIVFDNANAYTLSGAVGDTITLSNGIATAGITVNTGSHVISVPAVLATDTLVSTAGGTTIRLNGNVTGEKTFTATGSGTTILAGTNAYGNTVVSSGTLQIGDGGNTGTLGSGDVAISIGAALAFNRTDNYTVSNNIGGTTGQVTKLGAGTLTLTGTNTFGTVAGGGLNVNGGIVKVASAGALPTGILLNFANGTLDLNQNTVTAGSISGSTGTITDSSTNVGTTTFTVDEANASNFGGTISDGPTRQISVVKRGPAALTLSGNNTYSGGLTITNGAVIASGLLGTITIPGNVTLGDGTNVVFLISGQPANPNQFGANSVLTFSNATTDAKFELRGSTATLAGIDSSPTTTLSIIQNDEIGTPGYAGAPGLATLTLNTSSDHSFTGLIRNQNGGGLNLVKEGPGTQEIRNVAAQADNFNTATINAGRLTFNFAGTNNTLGASTTINLGPNGTLGLDGVWTMNRPITGTGNVIKVGTGTVTLSGTNSQTGVTTVSQGTLTAATVGGTSLPGNVVVGTEAQAGIFLIMGAENQFGPNSVLGFNNGTGRDAKMELRGFNQTVAGLESGADDTLSIVQNQESGTPVAATLTINATTDHVFNGIIRTQSTGGLLSLVKDGPGTQELRNVPGAGYNFGSATINAGKLVFNLNTLPGGVAGHDSLGVNVVTTVNLGGTLGLDGNWDMNRPVSGQGDMLKQGSGIVSISSVLTHTGNTTVSGGALVVAGSLSGTAKVDVQSGGTLGGFGTISPATAATGNVNILAGGKLAPGSAVGLTTGTLTAALSGGGAFDISLAVTAANSQAMLFDLDSTFSSDRVMLTGGALKIGTGVLAFDDFAFTALGGFDVGTYTLFDGDMPIIGSLDPVAAHLTGAIGPLAGTIALGDNGNDLVLLVAVPEPGSVASLLIGMGVLGLRRRRRSSR